MIWFDVFGWQTLNKQFKIMQNRSKLRKINQYRTRIGIPKKSNAFEEFSLNLHTNGLSSLRRTNPIEKTSKACRKNVSREQLRVQIKVIRNGFWNCWIMLLLNFIRIPLRHDPIMFEIVDKFNKKTNFEKIDFVLKRNRRQSLQRSWVYFGFKMF